MIPSFLAFSWFALSLVRRTILILRSSSFPPSHSFKCSSYQLEWKTTYRAICLSQFHSTWACFKMSSSGVLKTVPQVHDLIFGRLRGNLHVTSKLCWKSLFFAFHPPCCNSYCTIISIIRRFFSSSFYVCFSARYQQKLQLYCMHGWSVKAMRS